MITKRLGVENFGYKVIAVLITLILWVMVVSQREMISLQKLTVQFVVPPGYHIEGPEQVEVDVRIEGPRHMIKRFVERSWPTKLVIPIQNPVVGVYSAEIQLSDFQLPPEIKVLSFRPREVVLKIGQ